MCTFPLWAFALMIAILLGVDMLMHRKAHEISMREALLSSAFWIGLALLFNLWIWHCRGTHDALLFLTAYLVEESLSIDNLFVFLLIFKYFHVPSRYLHKVLFWGIFGAIVFRALFIVGGLALISHVEWVLYLFALFLIYAGIKLALEKDQKIDPAANPILGYLSRHFKVTHDSSTGKFRDDFASQAAEFTKTVEDSKAVTEGTVTAAALVSMDDHSALVLVAATSRVTNLPAGKEQQPRAWRLKVTVTEDGGQYKMSKVEFVP